MSAGESPLPQFILPEGGIVVLFACLFKRLIQVPDKVLHVLYANGQAYLARRDASHALVCLPSWECVVVAGWMTSDLASATFARWENICRLSINFVPSSAPPLSSKVKMEPGPLGRYFCASS